MTQVAGFDQITLDYTCVATQNYPSLFLQQQERIALKFHEKLQCVCGLNHCFLFVENTFQS